jgi:putative PIN family toxin of toxin-antitoxin system
VQVVIDTNIWISFLIGKSFYELYDLMKNRKIEVLSSKTQIEEFLKVTQRDKFRRYFNFDEIEYLLHFFERNTVLVDTKKKVHICKDKKDNYILEIALNGNADCIITGDNDLLELNPFENIEILIYKDFIEKLKV